MGHHGGGIVRFHEGDTMALKATTTKPHEYTGRFIQVCAFKGQIRVYGVLTDNPSQAARTIINQRNYVSQAYLAMTGGKMREITSTSESFASGLTMTFGVGGSGVDR